MRRINDDPYAGPVEVIFVITTLLILAYFLPLIITIFVLFPLVLKIYLKMSTGICKSLKRIDGQTVIITGGNIGIGLETAKDLARRGGKIILACRNLEKGKAALDEIERDTGSNLVVLKHLNLNSLKSVRKFCSDIKAEESRLDILINNAGGMVYHKIITEDNLESCIQGNHFGPFLLTNLLLDLMRKTGNARIVNLSSLAHRLVFKFDPDNLNAEMLKYISTNHMSYFHIYFLTKLANNYFTIELNRRLKAADIQEITVNCLHPGGVKSGFLDSSNHVWYRKIINPILSFFLKTCIEGAQTTLHVALAEELDNVSGEYFEDCQKCSTSLLAKNLENAKILWEKSVESVGLKPEETIV